MIRRPLRSRQLRCCVYEYVRRQLSLAKASRSPITDAIGEAWELQAQGAWRACDPMALNVMPDLATAMKYNPRLKAC